MIAADSMKSYDKAMARQELYRRGNLKHLLHTGQERIQATLEKSLHQLQVVLCARGYGKTYWGAQLSVSLAIKKPKARIKIGTEFQTDLEALILPNFEAVLEGCPPDCRPKWNATKSKFVFPNGSEIALIGLDRKPNGLRGQHGIDLIILEEAGFISKLEQIYTSVIVPITTHRPDAKIVLISTPPESLDHYFWTFVDRAILEGSLSTFTIDENPMLTADRILKLEKEMGGRESTSFQREYLCKRIADATRTIVPEFSREKHVQAFSRPAYFPFLYKNEGLDLGAQDLTVQLYAVYDFPTATLFIEAETVLKGNQVLSKTLYDETAKVEARLSYRTDSDEAGGEDKIRRHSDTDLLFLNEINALGKETRRYWATTAKDNVEAGINMLRMWFKKDRIKVHPSCQTLLLTLETGLWNKRRDDFNRSAVVGHCDAIAALVYLVRNVNQTDNPIPYTFQVDQMNAAVMPRAHMSETAKTLKNAFGGRPT